MKKIADGMSEKIARHDVDVFGLCKVCGDKGETRLDEGGRLWLGTKGYSEPQFFTLRHFCRDISEDKFLTNDLHMRGRSEADLLQRWNELMRDGGDRCTFGFPHPRANDER